MRLLYIFNTIIVNGYLFYYQINHHRRQWVSTQQIHANTTEKIYPYFLLCLNIKCVYDWFGCESEYLYGLAVVNNNSTGFHMKHQQQWNTMIFAHEFHNFNKTCLCMHLAWCGFVLIYSYLFGKAAIRFLLFLLVDTKIILSGAHKYWK